MITRDRQKPSSTCAGDVLGPCHVARRKREIGSDPEWCAFYHSATRVRQAPPTVNASMPPCRHAAWENAFPLFAPQRVRRIFRNTIRCGEREPLGPLKFGQLHPKIQEREYSSTLFTAKGQDTVARLESHPKMVIPPEYRLTRARLQWGRRDYVRCYASGSSTLDRLSGEERFSHSRANSWGTIDPRIPYCSFTVRTRGYKSGHYHLLSDLQPVDSTFS